MWFFFNSQWYGEFSFVSASFTETPEISEKGGADGPGGASRRSVPTERPALCSRSLLSRSLPIPTISLSFFLVRVYLSLSLSLSCFSVVSISLLSLFIRVLSLYLSHSLSVPSVSPSLVLSSSPGDGRNVAS